MKKALYVLAALPLAAEAHFGIIVPDHAMVCTRDEAIVSFTIAFAHPMEGEGMTMEKPAAFYSVDENGRHDLSRLLSEDTIFGHSSWKAAVRFSSPGVSQFVVEPRPYWEPAEDKHIIHYTKVVVPAFGAEDGWNTPVGVKAEIVPLSRPFANYAGNVFQGRVMVDGRPVPGCPVEIEFFNRDGARKSPNDYFITQGVVTDDRGVFTFGIPWDGWWGFAALTDSEEKINGKEVEIGAVIWVNFAKP